MTETKVEAPVAKPDPDTEIVLRYKGKRNAAGQPLETAGTVHGVLEARHLTRAYVKRYIQTSDVLAAVLEGGLYEVPDGVSLRLPAPEKPDATANP